MINRRLFLANSLAAVGAATLIRAQTGGSSFRLKTEKEYRQEAAQYSAAIQELRQLHQKRTVQTNPKAAAATIERLAPALKYQLSSFVVTALSNPAFVAAVRAKVASPADLERFAAAGVRSLKTFTELDGVRSVQAEIEKISVRDRQALSELAAALNVDSAKEAQKEAEFDQECAKVFSIVVAVILVVIAIVVAATTFGAAGSAVQGTERVQRILVTPLAEKYGPNLSDAIVEKGQLAADAGYARCMANLRNQNGSDAQLAILKCQSRWLRQKSAWFV